MRARRTALLHGIYVIFNEEPNVIERAAAVVNAGVRIVQYRAKIGMDAEHLRALRKLTSAHDALLILNDDWRAARSFDCDGVHLGPGDAGFHDVAAVRAALPQAVVGLSCGTHDEVRSANSADVDYLGVGSVYATGSKADAGAPIGIDGLRALARQSRVPVAAIGGITAATLPDVRAAGVAMAAVIGAVASARDAGAAARDLIASWNSSA
ncbi:MAG: thiamine phosphate synthase [Candidatus Eremiobacteraeota bacterium]|nr:thiamine phosphate synthase [Candidatus Eremiobacteraeota bacterium]